MADRSTILLYFDYKSPFSYLAAAPAFGLAERFDIEIEWRPYLLRVKGPGQRSIYSEWKIRYSYLDARRAANRRGGFPIRGPHKVYDSRPALIGGLYAAEQNLFRPYTETVFRHFFDRRLEIDRPEEIAALLDGLGASGGSYLRYRTGAGARALEHSIEAGHRDQIFGVPTFLFAGEPFWGYDRIALLEERLREAGLGR